MKNAQLNESIGHIFNEYKERIINAEYYPIYPIDTLKARIAAIWLLESDDIYLVEKASLFIKKTSISNDDDFDRLCTLSTQIKKWDELEICSIYSNIAGQFVEYKLRVTTTDDIEQTIHRHSLYQTQEGKCCFVSQFSPLIRVIGDPVLHEPGIVFPQDPSETQRLELAKQIEHAKSVLIQTGGAGIAANQCAGIDAPYRFTIVGVFYDIPDHVSGLEKRYPGTRFPPARIMVNPTILNNSEATQSFNHACLSVPCGNKCEVKSPQEITVEYQDPNQDMISVTVTLQGVDAVVLWHELNHILCGKTYIDTTFEALSSIELDKIKGMIIKEQEKRLIDSGVIPALSVLPFHITVKINNEGVETLNEEALTEVLPNTTNETLTGLLDRCRALECCSTLRATHRSINFFKDSVEQDQDQDQDTTLLCEHNTATI
jgi:peptide deformylase